MRISDWSSDVCSSDLLELQEYRCHPAIWRRADRRGTRLAGRGSRYRSQRRLDRCDHRDEPRRPERKSVVSGKRVSVRVDLVGRRIRKISLTHFFFFTFFFFSSFFFPPFFLLIS